MTKLIRDPHLDELVKELNQTGSDEQPGAPAGPSWPPALIPSGNPIEALLIDMARRGASDLLILSGTHPIFRVAGRLLAASRPLPVLGLRAASSQARGFAYFAAKVHPDVRLIDEGGSMMEDRLDAALYEGATALLCFALPRHPREVVETLERSRRAGLTVVTVADSAFAPVARHSDLLIPAPVGTGLAFDTACAPMLLGRVLLEAMADALPDAQARLEAFDARAAARGLFVE